MGALLSDILSYLWQVVLTTITQIFILLGPLILLAFIMHIIAKKNENLSYRVMGRKAYLYGFAWLGTSVHELGHAFFAKIFRHKITDMALFTPHSNDGSLGHVNHSFNPKSTYQRIGNFFIGIGPILFGAIVLYIMSWLLFGFGFSKMTIYEIQGESFFSFNNLGGILSNTWDNIIIYLGLVFGASSSIFKVIILIYFLYAIGSSITLSRSDIKSSIDGFIFFVLGLLIFNLFSSWIGDFTLWLLTESFMIFFSFYFLMLLSIIINLVFVGILSVLAKLLHR